MSETTTSTLPAWWQSFNSEENPWPFLISLFIFGSGFVYCYAFHPNQKKAFMKWNALHNFHNVTALIMACCSIYINDDSIFNERVPILFSWAYFLVDLPDCIIQWDVGYLWHAILVLTCGYMNYTTPLHRELRLNSKAIFCELSTPLLHLTKKTRDPLHSALFLLTFTCCRILWIPYIMYEIYQHEGYFFKWGDYRMPVLVAFYGLNVFWYFKIIAIGVKMVRGGNDKQDKVAKKKE